MPFVCVHTVLSTMYGFIWLVFAKIIQMCSNEDFIKTSIFWLKLWNSSIILFKSWKLVDYLNKSVKNYWICFYNRKNSSTIWIKSWKLIDFFAEIVNIHRLFRYNRENLSSIWYLNKIVKTDRLVFYSRLDKITNTNWLYLWNRKNSSTVWIKSWKLIDYIAEIVQTQYLSTIRTT